MITLEQTRSSQRLAGQIRRYHEYPTVQDQTNADHSWHVARVWMAIFGIGDYASLGKMLLYIHHHDSGELGSGDLPFPTKANNPDLKAAMDRLEGESLSRQGVDMPKLTAWEKASVKIADLIEMAEFGMEEVRRGCVYGESTTHVTLTKVREIIATGVFTDTDVRVIRKYVNAELGEVI